MKTKNVYAKTIALFTIFLLSSAILHSQTTGNALNAALQEEQKALLLDSLELDRQQRDSLRIAELTLQVQEMKMNEILLQNEASHTKYSREADSLRRENQRKQIDSLRISTPGIPVVIEKDTLFKLYAKRGGVTPTDRATNVSKMILQIGKSLSLVRDSIYLLDSEYVTDIMGGEKVIISITDQDGIWQNKTREELTEEYLPIITQKIDELHTQYGLMMKIKRILLFTLVVLVQIALIYLTIKVFKKFRRRIARFAMGRLKPIQIKGYEFLNRNQQGRVFLFLSSVLRLLLIIVQLLISIPILFSIFPETENLALLLFSYVWNPIKTILIAVVKYIPNIFKIIIIYLCFKYIVKGIKFLANEVATERLKLGGFYSDWAFPTYYIIRFLMYSFMVIMIWPLLPNSDSPIFSGVSVFVGLIISLGSTTVIGNLMAGMVITYMRPFRIGDRIKLNETTGDVVEKTPFVTRIKTLKSEIVTIPNSFIMSSHTINYSESARRDGIIIHSDITVGYDVHWKKVQRLLLEAADEVPGLLKNPKPFVLELKLEDFYCCYQINAYTREDKRLPRLYTALHQRIQDKFNAEGIEMLSPHYYAKRDGNDTMIPPQFIQKPDGTMPAPEEEIEKKLKRSRKKGDTPVPPTDQ